MALATSARARAVALRATAGLAAGALLVLAFLHLVNIGDMYERLRHLSVAPALACGAAFLAAYVVRALRWRCLLRPSRVSIRHATAIYQVGIFLNWLLPIRGGEIAMSLLLRRSDQIPVNKSLAAVSMDKAMDLLPAAGLLALVPFLGLHLSLALWLVLAGALAAVALGLAVVALAAWRRELAVALLALLTRPLEAVIAGTVREHIGPFVTGFVDTLVALLRRPRVLLVAAACTAVALGLDTAFALLAFRAVGVTVPLLTVLYGYTLFNLSFILPSPPGQIGSNELIGLLIFSGVFRVSRAGVGAMFLFSHPWTGLLMTISGLLCLAGMGLTVRGTVRLAQGERAAQGQGERPAQGQGDWKGDDGSGNGSGGLPRQPRDPPAYSPGHAAADAHRSW